MKPCISIFGSELTVPPDVSIHMIYDLNQLIEEPFRIYNICTGVEEDNTDETDETVEADAVNVKVIIGFIPSNDLDKLVDYSKKLLVYMEDNPILQGFDISTPQFHSGIECDEDDDEEDNVDDDTVNHTNEFDIFDSSFERMFENCIINNELDDLINEVETIEDTVEDMFD